MIQNWINPNLYIAKFSASKENKFLLRGVKKRGRATFQWGRKLDIFCKKGLLHFSHCRHQQSVLEPKTYQSVEIQMIDYPFFCPYAHSSWEGVSIFNDGYLNGQFFRNLDHCAKFLPTNQCSSESSCSFIAADSIVVCS